MPHYTAENPPPKVQLICEDDGRTRQSEKDACDINQIMARYVKTGMIPVSQREAFFMDVSAMPDYRTACDRVNEADAFFMSLPAEVRKRFSNSPAEFLDFVSDPANEEEMVEMGLLPDPGAAAVEPAPEPEPAPAPEPPPAP